MHVHEHLPLDELQRLAKTISRKRVWLRSQAVILATQGRSVTEIAHALGCSPRAAQKWIARSNQGGPHALAERPHTGRPPRRAGPELLRFQQRLEAGPTPEDRVCTFRGRDLQRILEHEFGVLMSLQAVSDLLHRHGFSSLMPRPQHKDADEQLQAIFNEVVVDQIQAIREAHPDDEVQVWFEDEARFGQQGTRTRVWARRGTRPRGVRQTHPCEYADVFQRNYLGRLEFDSPTKEAPLVLPAILNPFIEGAPAAVMTRIALDWIIDGTPLNELFDEVAEDQYTRELTLTHFVQVMLDVASGHRPSPRAAFLRRKLSLVASLSAFYRKLNRMELAVPEAVVGRTASRARQLIVASGGLMPEPIEGYAVRILDGNVMTGTEHRIGPLRTTGSAGLPGLSLAVYEPASGLILDLILEEDAHCQERALVDRVEVRPGQLWIMDRNFCMRALVFRIARREAFFLVRWHRSTLPFRPAGRLRACGRCSSGEVFEQPIEVDDGEGGVHRLRRIVLKWDQPTRDGEAEIVLVTNLPAEVTTLQCCEAYRGRWQIEGHYQALTELLHCEVPGLGYPRAALFAFSMSAVAGNALAVLKGNLRVAHGVEVASEVSDFALVDEVAEVYPGMRMAVPPARWPKLTRSRAATVSRLLNELAERVAVHRMFRCRRGPKKPRPRRSSGKRIHHVSNKKLLDRARGPRAPARGGRNLTTPRT